jgi:TRAP-type mannitol/chloroaromatic compound transport system permease large subunit
VIGVGLEAVAGAAVVVATAVDDVVLAGTVVLGLLVELDEGALVAVGAVVLATAPEEWLPRERATMPRMATTTTTLATRRVRSTAER